MRGVDRGHNIFEGVIVVATGANLLITELLLDLDIIKPVLLTKFAKFLANYFLNVFVRECLSRYVTHLAIISLLRLIKR